MILAMDFLRWPCARLVLASSALVLLLSDTGCARVREFRQGTPNAFGTNTAWSDSAPPATKAPRGDLYAQLATKQSTEVSPNEKVASLPSQAAEPPRIALQPPVSQPRAIDVAKPTSAPAPATPPLGMILAESRLAVDALTSYRVKMTHQERVGDTLNPVEDVVLNIRRNPNAVRLEWPTGPNHGREVIYAADANKGLMHVKMPESVVPLPRLSMPPDSPLAMRNSRHPINEAGFDTILENLELSYQGNLRADRARGLIRYEGLEVPEGLSQPCHKLVRVTPTNETWTVYLDPQTHLPASVQAVSGQGELLERFTFRDPILNLPELAKADAFDPDARWGPSKGFFSRLAGATTAADSTTRTR
jgi:Protein of unknown function (DUF1571)